MVYWIRAGREGPIKIGLATDPRRRLASLQTAHHEELILLAVADGGADLEAELHRAFRAQRIRGEWFAVSPELLAVVEEARGVRPVPGSFEDYCELEPRLARLAEDAAAAGEQLRRRPGCGDFVMRRQIEPRLHRLCGWGRALEGPPLRTKIAYEVAFKGLQDLVGPCRSGCGCVSHGV